MNFASSSKSSGGKDEVLIIHHISDIHLNGTREGQQALFAYSSYVQSRKDEEKPTLVVITGDLTKTGSENELKTVAGQLQAIFSPWKGQLKERIFVVPGPYDLNWFGKEGSHLPSFQLFSQIFEDFGLPDLSINGKMKPGNVVPNPTAPYLVHLVNTCFDPEELPDDLVKHLDALTRRYKLYQDEYKALYHPFKVGGKKNNDPQKEQEKQRGVFLSLIEDVLVSLADGTLRKEDIEAFDKVATAHDKRIRDDREFIPSSEDPLRILVSHHPLITYPDKHHLTERAFENLTNIPARRLLNDLLTKARANHFHLALHGHNHQPQLLSDLSIIGDIHGHHPIRQIGAGSLGGEDGAFNEITAIRKPKEKIWRLQMRTVSLNNPSDQAISMILLNPAEGLTDSPSEVKKLQEDHDTRVAFEQQIQIVMDRFNATVESRAQLIPYAPCDVIAETIRKIVFPGFDCRIALAIKKKDTHSLWELENNYIVPTISRDQNYLHPLPYPTTVAAWALILGEILTFPDVKNRGETLIPDRDFARLQRLDKLIVIEEALDERRRYAHNLGHSGDEERCQHLLSCVRAHRLKWSEVYHVKSDDGKDEELLYPFFIAVPIPMRWHDEDHSKMEEIGTLHIDVRLNDDQGSLTEKEIFTDMRKDMLHTLSKVLYTILMTSDRLAAPKGSWHHR